MKQVLALSMLALLLLAAWAGINPTLAAAALRSVRDARRWRQSIDSTADKE